MGKISSSLQHNPVFLFFSNNNKTNRDSIFPPDVQNKDFVLVWFLNSTEAVGYCEQWQWKASGLKSPKLKFITSYYSATINPPFWLCQVNNRTKAGPQQKRDADPP